MKAVRAKPSAAKQHVAASRREESGFYGTGTAIVIIRYIAPGRRFPAPTFAVGALLRHRTGARRTHRK